MSRDAAGPFAAALGKPGQKTFPAALFRRATGQAEPELSQPVAKGPSHEWTPGLKA